MGKKLRFKVGDRVTVSTGDYAGQAARIRSRADRRLWPRCTWLIELADTGILASVHRSALGPYAVPPEARPVSVGALHHSEVRRG